ncbi:VOC family protein [Aliikangiella coralliicola]|uniref:VOC family protein n=1 Tax=Aliikangiella coralliicola TaxID=2592383 RepID=A0A545U7H7_9GAMM|nr:VOC family protein [Aliikangiella coralliicola]TQV85422.1 VOC family protein [Aliikangiella coralliicola]
MANPIPEGFTSITPHIIINGGADMLEFYKSAFNAEITMCMPGPDDLLMHAELKIGDAMVMVGSNQWGEEGPKAPNQLGGSSCFICLYVEDTDNAYQQALTAGAEEVMPPADMFWGDRYCQVRDPSGHIWSIATHMEDLTGEEIAQRGAEWFASMGNECG